MAIGNRKKVILISAVAMFLGWVDIAEATDFAVTITSAPPPRFWFGLLAAGVITLGFPLWRLRRSYRGFWQETIIGFFGLWLVVTVTLLTIGLSNELGWGNWLSPVLLTMMLWIAQEMDAQKHQRDGPGESTGKTA